MQGKRIRNASCPVNVSYAQLVDSGSKSAPLGPLNRNGLTEFAPCARRASRRPGNGRNSVPQDAVCLPGRRNKRVGASPPPERGLFFCLHGGINSHTAKCCTALLFYHLCMAKGRWVGRGQDSHIIGIHSTSFLWNDVLGRLHVFFSHSEGVVGSHS